MMPSRRRLLQMLGAVAAVGAGGWALLSGSRANAYYQGPVSDHFDGVRFFNPSGTRPKGPGAFLKWQLGERGESWPASFPSPFPPDRPPARFDGEGVRIAYVGHATFLMQTRGMNVLIDPVWAERVSPLSFAGPKRVNAPGIAFDDLPKIDAVLVTHNHYDHMDVETVGRLWQRFRPRIITPLGNDTILRRSVPGPGRQTPSTGSQVIDLGDGLRVHAEPTPHWSARGAGDRMHALWASFVLRGRGPRRSTASAIPDLATGAHLQACRQAPSGLGAGAAADRRLRAALVHAQQPHEPGGGRARRWSCAVPARRSAITGARSASPTKASSGRSRRLTAALAGRAMPADRFPALRPGEVRIV